MDKTLCTNRGEYPLAWRSFESQMRGRVYGREETADAWEMFLNGWRASVRVLQEDEVPK